MTAIIVCYRPRRFTTLIKNNEELVKPKPC